MSSTVLKSLSQRGPILGLNAIFRNSYSSNVGQYTTYDLVVVGGGIVGCATAREMLQRHPKFKIAIVEKEDDVAKHQTGHNSGVIHTGIYYKPGSMKAKMCVEGLKLSYDYINKNNIPHKKTGKLIVATNHDELQKLKDLHDRGLKNNVPELQLIDKDEIKKHEPKCKGEKALWSPWTGIVDWSVVCRHFVEDFKKMGGQLYLNFEVTGFSEVLESKGANDFVPVSVQSKDRTLLTKHVVTCGGLHSDRLAVMTGCNINPRIVPFRGEYLEVKDAKKDICKTNIYPVPDPNFPFLGVHFTPRINGELWLGPNSILAFSREGYRWRDINIKDCIEILKFGGLYKLAFKHFKFGCNEIIKSIFYPLAVKESQKFIPDITYTDVKRGKAGVRAQAMDTNGTLIDDFVFDTGIGKIGSNVLHVRNAPSPGATSSMAIAKAISDKLEKDFKF